jgi:transposase-like protein/ribosomal protein L37AE/L43A
MDAFGTDDRCREILEELRWPSGVACPRCASPKLSRIRDRGQFDCDSCRYQFSATAGTVFHDSHLPLRKWFIATYLMTESKKGISANQIKRMLGVSYKTAWFLCHRIRSAMQEAEPTMLSGTVEADETYIGGKATGFHSKKEASQGRLRNKTIVLGAIERGGKVRLRVVPNARKNNILGFLEDVVADEAVAVYTDEFRSYDKVGDRDTIHASVNHRREEWVRGDVHTNTVESVWSLFDRAMIGSYHQLSRKHLASYLQEFEWRFNNRENPYLFRDTLTRLISAEALPYKELTA